MRDTRLLCAGVAIGSLLLGLGWSLSRPVPVEVGTTPHPTEAVRAETPAPSRFSVSVRATPDASALGSTFDEFLSQVTVQPAGRRPADVLAEALAAGGVDPLGYRQALDAALKTGGPQAVREAVELLRDGLRGADDKLRFQHSQALALRLGDPQALSAVLGAIETAQPETRADLVFALRGSRDPRASETLARLYDADADPQVRAQAGFVIGERGAEWPPLLLERARATARLDLSSDSAPLIKSAADVLGVPPLSDSDRTLLLGTLERDPDLRRRVAAARALAASGAPAPDVVAAFRRLRDDPATTPELRAGLEAVLEGIR